MPAAEPLRRPNSTSRVVASSAAQPPRAIIGTGWQNAQQPKLANFRNWTARYLGTPDNERASLLPEGIALASSRREALAALIRTDPERALAAATPQFVRDQLPVEVVALLEERISGYGELALNCALPGSDQTGPDRLFWSALINGREFNAFTYGRRAALATVPVASLQGIAVDHALAVSDSPLRVLEPGERLGGRPVGTTCAVTGESIRLPDGSTNIPQGLTAVEVAGRIQLLGDADAVPMLESQLMARELAGGAYEADNQPGTSGVTGRPSHDWTHGPKKALIILVDFSDLAGRPANSSDGQSITEDYAVNRFTVANGVQDFYTQNSFGKTSLFISPATGGDSPDVTAVLRMPRTAVYYATNDSNLLLHNDARAAAQAAGFNVDAYDRIGVVFSKLGNIPGSKITYGGMGSITGKNFWMNGHYTFRIVAHEIGHNYGLRHANLWQVSDGNPVSTSGASIEYEDIFDLMGNADSFENHFSPWHKNMLRWIPDTAVLTVATGGTYRVYRFDDSGANLSNPLALKIVRDLTHDYWIGHRRGTGNASLDNGAYVLWGYKHNQASDLLDLNTPGTDLDDAALAVGATFNDSAAGILLHPVARGGSGPDEWLDVQVTFQPRIQFASTTFFADEQSGHALITFNRLNNGAGAVSVNFNTSNESATAPADYTSTNGTVIWASGDLSPKTISIPVVADASLEGAEFFTVLLSNPSGGVIAGSASATVTIIEPGAGDPTFAPNNVSSRVKRIIVQPDGKLLLGGAFATVQDANFASYARVGITRLQANGTVETEFAAEGGIAGPSSPEVEDMIRQPDGKIIIVGTFTIVNGTARNNVARLNVDGSLDTSFTPGTGANDTIYAVELQPDGKLLLGGAFTSFNENSREYLVRLNSNGSVDAGFTGPDFGGTGAWRVESLAFQPDGRILVGGQFYFNSANFKAGLCRLTSTGSLDSSFFGIIQGAHTAGSPNSLRSVFSIVPQLDGTILIGGTFTAFNNTARAGLARLTSTGALDPAFAPTSDGACHAILVQPDGRILVGGSFTILNGAAVGHFGRLSSTGTLDPTFVTSGTSESVDDFALQPDGRLLFSGDYGSFGSGDGPVWRIFSGLPALPGTIQWSADFIAASEGNTTTLTATRVGGSAGVLKVNYATVPSSATTSDFTPASGTLTWADGETASKTVPVSITTDAATEGTESFHVNLGAPLMGGAILGTIQQVSVNISDPVAGFAAWQAANFTPTEMANSQISGDTADPDNDGIKNILEYAFGLAPKTPNTTGVPIGANSNVGGINYLTLTFRRRNPAADLLYTPYTANAPNGSWAANAIATGSPFNNGDGTETVTYRDNTAAQPPTTQRFMKVDVQKIP